MSWMLKCKGKNTSRPTVRSVDVETGSYLRMQSSTWYSHVYTSRTFCSYLLCQCGVVLWVQAKKLYWLGEKNSFPYRGTAKPIHPTGWTARCTTRVQHELRSRICWSPRMETSNKAKLDKSPRHPLSHHVHPQLHEWGHNATTLCHLAIHQVQHFIAWNTNLDLEIIRCGWLAYITHDWNWLVSTIDHQNHQDKCCFTSLPSYGRWSFLDLHCMVISSTNLPSTPSWMLANLMIHPRWMA